jgi:MFS superfamily sulfate permease-like transporter
MLRSMSLNDVEVVENEDPGSLLPAPSPPRPAQVDLFGDLHPRKSTIVNEEEMFTLVSIRERQKKSSLLGSTLAFVKFRCCSKAGIILTLTHRIPVLDWLPKYEQCLFTPDLVAGLTACIMIVPQSVAFSLLAGLPAQYGLYSGIFPIIVYSIFCTSRHMHFGPFAIVSLLVGHTTESIVGRQGPGIVGGDDPEYIAVAVSLTLASGLWLLLLGILRLGKLVVLLSDPVVSAVTCAAAFAVFTSQAASLIGISKPSYSDPLSVVRSWQYIFTHLYDADWRTSLVGLTSVALLLGIRSLNLKLKWKIPIPGELLAGMYGH